ncbi:D-glycero-beta-D-manno-heptose 1-phosphate adenylyltransferase [bacterium]|nr:D-glycero-beta-D-manno-heptose 1-phosphate adenylyltransferase [bacterium]
MRAGDSKVRRLAEMPGIVSGLKALGKKVVFTNGCFDLLHNGHVRYLSAARNCGDVLVVAVNSDSSIRRLKGKTRPLTPSVERMEVLSALLFVDYVLEFDEDDPQMVIETIVPDVLIKGSDWAMNEIIGREFVTSQGGDVMRIPLVESISTSSIVELIRTGSKNPETREVI